MAAPKPIVLDETGQEIGEKILENGQLVSETVSAMTHGVDQIIEAMGRLDIIYYVEQ